MALQRTSSRLRASRFSRFSDNATRDSGSTEAIGQRRTLREHRSVTTAEASSAMMASQSLLADIDAVLATPLPVPVCSLTLARGKPRIPGTRC